MKTVKLFFCLAVMLLGLSTTRTPNTATTMMVVVAQEEEGGGGEEVVAACNCDDAETAKEQMRNAMNDLQAKMEEAFTAKAEAEQHARNVQGELQGKLDELQQSYQQAMSAGEELKKMNNELTAQKSDLEAKMASLSADAESNVRSLKAELDESAAILEKYASARFYVNFELLKSDILGLVSNIKSALGMKDEL